MDGLCGREIRNAVIDAALQAAMRDAPHVSRQNLLDAIGRVKASRLSRDGDAVDHPLTPEEQQAVERAVNGQVA